MARIAGVNIPTNKRVEIALTYIHGIGPTKAKEITTKLGIATAAPSVVPHLDWNRWMNWSKASGGMPSG